LLYNWNLPPARPSAGPLSLITETAPARLFGREWVRLSHRSPGSVPRALGSSDHTGACVHLADALCVAAAEVVRERARLSDVK